MKTITALLLAVFLVGCATNPEQRSNGTIPFTVRVEASDPCRIEVNGEYVGDAPGEIKVWGDKDGTFHEGGMTVINAIPTKRGQQTQTKIFSNGAWLGSSGDRIPSRLYFDMELSPIGEKSTIDLNINKKP